MRDQVLRLLGSVSYPGFSRDIVSAGVVTDVRVEEGTVTLALSIPDASPSVIEKIHADIRAALEPEFSADKIVFRGAAGAAAVSLKMVGKAPSAARAGSAEAGLLPGVRHVIAVASGKGGVGKSTIAVNLALCRLFVSPGLGLPPLTQEPHPGGKPPSPEVVGVWWDFGTIGPVRPGHRLP